MMRINTLVPHVFIHLIPRESTSSRAQRKQRTPPELQLHGICVRSPPKMPVGEQPQTPPGTFLRFPSDPRRKCPSGGSRKPAVRSQDFFTRATHYKLGVKSSGMPKEGAVNCGILPPQSTPALLPLGRKGRTQGGVTPAELCPHLCHFHPRDFPSPAQLLAEIFVTIPGA